MAASEGFDESVSVWFGWVWCLKEESVWGWECFIVRVTDLGVWVRDFESLRKSDFESDEWVWKFESDERGGDLIGQKSSFCNLSL